MKHLILLPLFFVLADLNTLQAQFKNYNTEKDIWHEGEITDQRGRKLKGLINYNFVVDQVKIQLPSGEVLTMIPNNTQSFTMVDSLGTQTFHSLPYDIENRGRLNPTFFREVYRNEDYALLSRHHLEYSSPVVISEAPSTSTDFVSDNPSHNFPYRSSGKELVIETVYFADRKGTIIPILHGKKSTDWTPKLTDNVRYNQRKLKRSNLNKEATKFKFVNYRDNFHDFFGEDVANYKMYAKSNKLNLRTIDGLAQSLNFK